MSGAMSVWILGVPVAWGFAIISFSAAVIALSKAVWHELRIRVCARCGNVLCDGERCACKRAPRPVLR